MGTNSPPTELHHHLDQSVEEIFETMVAVPARPTDRTNDIRVAEGTELIATLGFTGTHSGALVVSASQSCAAAVTAGLLCMDSADEITEEEMCDAIGEIANMIAGNLKNWVVESGAETMELAAPTIVEGNALRMATQVQDILDTFSTLFEVEGMGLGVSYYRRENN